MKDSHGFAEAEWERTEATYGPARIAVKASPSPRIDFDSLPPNPTIKDLARLWNTTVGSIHKRIARGQMPKPIRRKHGDVYRWRKEDIVIRFGPKVTNG